MSSDVSVTLRSSKTTFKANISALQSGKSDHRKVSPYPSRHRTAQDTRRTDGARRLPQPTEPWEEYDTDPAMNIIVVLLFPGRKEEPQRAGKPSVVKTHPSIDRMFTTTRFTMSYGDRISRAIWATPLARSVVLSFGYLRAILEKSPITGEIGSNKNTKKRIGNCRMNDLIDD